MVDVLHPQLGRVLTERMDGWVHFGGVSYQDEKMRAREYLETLLVAEGSVTP